jgi:glycerol-3-phosphate dehydrogenase (NAD(P)+)
MKIGLVGGGAWGTTLAQVLTDNQHDVLIYDIKSEIVDLINKHRHPFFEVDIPISIKATNDLNTLVQFSNIFVLSVPSKAIRQVLKTLNPFLNQKTYFVSVAKGIEPLTSKRISEIVKEEISQSHYGGFAVLTGPSHAEEVILRKLTLLVCASEDDAYAVHIQHLFANEQYLRIYTSKDLIGCELGGAMKNAIAVISGACTGLGLGENTRAAVISRGIVEIVRVVEMSNGKKETVFGLAGIGDLIVTASSNLSRNFQAGFKMGQGIPIEQIYQDEKQTIEGFRTIEAMYHFAKAHQIELPMIEAAYGIIHGHHDIKEALFKLLSRDLKSEQI